MAAILFFFAALLLYLLIGLYAARANRQGAADYLLAGGKMPAWCVALSAAATNNSGFMFIGQIGFTYQYGLQSIPLLLAWKAGDFAASLFSFQNIRDRAHATGEVSYIGLLASWNNEDYRYFRIFGGLLTLIFLTLYLAAQFNAGSKALHELFDWDYGTGAALSAGVLLLYTLRGGMRASIWTDIIQSFIMLFAMLSICIMGVIEIGGVTKFTNAIASIGPDYVSFFPKDTEFIWGLSAALFMFGWFCGGLSVSGQPQIMSRLMALDVNQSIWQTRALYFGWTIFFSLLTITAALVARVLIDDNAFDAELALPRLAGTILPDFFTGIVLAGLFAATLSTADSLVMSCSATISNDLRLLHQLRTHQSQSASLLVILFAWIAAQNDGASVFTLVLLNWSVIASAFLPILFVRSMNMFLSERLAIAMMICGVSSVSLWHSLGFTSVMYDAAVGIVAPMILYAIHAAAHPIRSEQIPSHLRAHEAETSSRKPH